MMPRSDIRSADRLTWTCLLVLSILWGLSFIFGKILVEVLDPLTLVWLRVGVAGVVLWIVCWLGGVSFSLTGERLRALTMMGIINNIIPFWLIFSGQIYIGAGEAAILVAATPFFTVLLGRLFTDEEKLSLSRLLGIAIGFVGVVLVMVPRTRVIFESGAQLFGQLAMLGTAFCYGIANVYGRRFRHLGIAPIAAATGQITASWLLLTPLIIVLPFLGVRPDLSLALTAMAGTDWLALIAFGAFSTAFAYILFFTILTRDGPVYASLVMLLVPISAVLISAIVLGEKLVWFQYAGMIVLAIGLLVLDGRLTRRKS